LPELPPFLGLVAVILLVLLNGFFVATEFALVAVRRSRIEQLVEEGHPTAPVVKRALEHLDTYIAATQLGITMASLALGWIGEPAMAHLVDPLLEVVMPRQWAEAGSHAVAVALSFTAITALHIVIGELAPKGLALQKPEATALVVTVPTTIFLRVFRPFIALLNGTGNLVLRLLGLSAGGGEQAVHTVEELRYLVRSSREAGVLDSTEEEIVGRALSLGDLSAHSVMVPRTEMASVPVDISREDLLDLAGSTHHMRFPVYEANTDQIVGVVFVADVIGWERAHPGKPFSVREALRPPLFVPESVKVDRLLAQMRAAHTHTAIVVDEFGGVAGMVTLQDLIERIVGEVPDVDEAEGPGIEISPDGSIRVDGLTPLAELERRLALRLEPMEAETVGGYVMETLGRVPRVGDEFDLSSYRLQVTGMDGNRVAEIVLLPSRG
jgi:CBS domain containing-hemolysin-like protein